MTPKHLLAFLLTATAMPAMADCSRPIQVPIAAIGHSVMVSQNQVSGIYPDAITEAGKRANCQFVFKPVPRARLEALFEMGSADMMLPVPRTARRDQYGIFIPVVQARAAVITVNPKLEPVRSLAQLGDLPLRVAVVRGFDYGEPYQRFMKEASRKGTLFVEVDAERVARLLQEGMADATVMMPTVLAGAILGDKRVAGLMDRLRIEPLEELDWTDTGIYLSRTSLGEADQRELARALATVGTSPAFWATYRRHYPPGVLNAGMRPRP